MTVEHSHEIIEKELMEFRQLIRQLGIHPDFWCIDHNTIALA